MYNPQEPRHPSQNTKILTSQPPSLHRQRLQLQRRRLDEAIKRHDPKYHTQYIHNVIAIPLNVARASTVDAAVLLGFRHTAEGLCDEVAFEVGERY